MVTQGDVLDRYQEQTNRLADATAARLAALWAIYDAGDLPADLMVGVGAAGLLQAKGVATRLADRTLSTVLVVSRGSDVLPLGLGTDDTTDALRKAVQTIIDDVDRNPLPRITRLGRAVPLDTAADTWHTGMRSRRVARWTRRTSGKSCAACVSLADGTALSVNTPMFRHSGCDCVAEPIERNPS